MGKKKKLNREEILRIQIREIEKHKWLMSELAGRDLGEEAVKDWVKKYAERFRDHWEKVLKEIEEEKDKNY